MFTDSIPARTETLQRYIRDVAVHNAIETHIDRVKSEGIDQKLIHEIAQLAAYNALTQFAAHLAGELASINSFYKMKADEAMLYPSSTMAADLMAAMQGRSGKEGK